MQVEPMNPTLKAPGTKRLKLKYDATAYMNCFQFQLAPLQGGAGGGLAAATALACTCLDDS